jgi:hypothetical protein
MSYGKYLSLRRRAMILSNRGDFEVNNAESNPLLFEEFVGKILENENLPPVIWEPFAGHRGRSKNQDFANRIGLSLISFDIEPSDTRVTEADSTTTGPGETVGGTFFHPPYFGTAPLSQNVKDISHVSDWDKYVEALKKTVRIISLLTVKDGFVCAVGRDYRHGGSRIRLDIQYLKLFESEGFKIDSVMESEPDVAMIFKKVGQ